MPEKMLTVAELIAKLRREDPAAGVGYLLIDNLRPDRQDWSLLLR